MTGSSHKLDRPTNWVVTQTGHHTDELLHRWGRHIDIVTKTRQSPISWNECKTTSKPHKLMYLKYNVHS